MIENAVAFFEQYKTDETLRAKVQAAVDAYPGSLEIREALVEHALLPIARELGLDFTVGELRAYRATRSTSPPSRTRRASGCSTTAGTTTRRSCARERSGRNEDPLL